MSVDFDNLLDNVKGLVRELRSIHSTIRKTRNSVAKELRGPLIEHVVKITKPVEELKRQITPEFADFAGLIVDTCMTNSNAMEIIAKYVAENNLISETEKNKILLDRRLKIVLELNRYHEPNATYAFILQHIDSVFMK